MRALRTRRGDRKAVGGCALALRCGGRRLRRRLRCGARVSVAPHNSLRSLRSLRSNRCGESVDEARGTRADRNPGLAGRAGRKRPAARQARTVHWTVRVRARLLAAAQARHRAPAHGFARQPGSWLEKDPSRASSPAGACTRACGARQATGSMPAACPSLTPKNGCSRKAAGGAQAGRMAPPRRRARTQTVQWTVCAWRAAGRLRPARPARPGLRSARVPARFVI